MKAAERVDADQHKISNTEHMTFIVAVFRTWPMHAGSPFACAVPSSIAVFRASPVSSARKHVPRLRMIRAPTTVIWERRECVGVGHERCKSPTQLTQPTQPTQPTQRCQSNTYSTIRADFADNRLMSTAFWRSDGARTSFPVSHVSPVFEYVLASSQACSLQLTTAVHLRPGMDRAAVIGLPVGPGMGSCVRYWTGPTFLVVQ